MCIEPYYTKPVEPSEKYAYTSADRPPIEAKYTESYYTKEALPC